MKIPHWTKIIPGLGNIPRRREGASDHVAKSVTSGPKAMLLKAACQFFPVKNSIVEAQRT